MAAPTASAPVPNAPVRRALTSQNTTAPSRHEHEVELTEAAAPVAVDARRTGAPRTTTPPAVRPTPHAARCRLHRTGVGVRECRYGRQLLDVHVLERQHAYRRHEAALAVHVPHPRVGEPHFDHGPVAVADGGDLHVVGEIEAPFGLHRVAEHGRHVLVLLSELQLAISLIVLEVLGAQRPAPETSTSAVPLLADLRSLPGAAPQVVELGPTHVAPFDDLELGDDRRVHGERALDVYGYRVRIWRLQRSKMQMKPG